MTSNGGMTHEQRIAKECRVEVEEYIRYYRHIFMELLTKIMQHLSQDGRD